MVQAYRLLSEEMYTRGWDYPLHLGVTEAGQCGLLAADGRARVPEWGWAGASRCMTWLAAVRPPAGHCSRAA